MRILYGTTNKGKLQAMEKSVKQLDIEIIGLNDLDCELPVINECGKTPLENAEIKARAYFEALHLPVFSCDSGLYFDELAEEEQPGIHVRRVNGKELNDDEMIQYYASLAEKYGGKITGRYRNAIYFILDEEHHYSSMDMSIATEPFILGTEPHMKRVEGFPLDALSIDIKSGEYYYDIEVKDVSTSVDDGVRAFFTEALVLNKNRKYYEAYDERYKQIHSMNLEWEANVHSSILDEMIAKLALNSQSKMLELGCGEGRDAIYLMKRGYDICAIDISPEAISFCKKKATEYADRFMVLNACEDSWDATYDFIYSIAVLHMLVLEEDRNKFLTFIRNHLNEDGYGLILSMGDGEMEHSSDISIAFDKQERVHVETGTKVSVASTSCRVVSFQTLERELEKNNLVVVERGITSIEPGFPVMMYALVKKNKENI